MNAGRCLASIGLVAVALAGGQNPASGEVIISISRSRLTPAFLEQYGFSCDQLWMMRNGLYARNGYRFTTARGIRAFGTGGTTSNPVLTPLERRNVTVIQRFEQDKGCPA